MAEQRDVKKAIFLASSIEGIPIARALANHLTKFTDVTLWTEGSFQPGKTSAESLAEVADRSDFAVFVFTPDDQIIARNAPSISPRVNLIFELGYLAGRMGLSRTVVVAEPHSIVLPTDIAGVLYIPLALPGSQDTQDAVAAVAPAAASIREFIARTPPRMEQPGEYSSCFISYSWNDKEFAAQLYDDLQGVGIRCWLDFKELKAGDLIPYQIDRAIQAHDKVLLVLSGGSVKSAWVRTEVANALALEQARQKTVLFPIRLDDAVFNVKGIPELEQLRQKYIIDFSNWQNKRLYQRSFSKLVRDLAISTSVESGGR